MIRVISHGVETTYDAGQFNIAEGELWVVKITTQPEGLPYRDVVAVFAKGEWTSVSVLGET